MVLKHTLSRWFPLFLISSLSLFFELAVIRWISGEVRLMAYFKNLSLLAAFLGLAIGFALVGKRDYRSACAPLLGLFVALVLAVGRATSPIALIYPGQGDEFFWWLSAPVADWLVLVLFLGIVIILFVTTMLLFIPLGQATGEEMARHAPLQAYMVNIFASLVGVWTFAFLSSLQTPPAIWFGLGMLGLALYLAIRQTLSRARLAIFGLVTVGLVIFGQGTTWSPYQRLEVTELRFPRQNGGAPVKVGYTLNIQQVYFQRAIDLSPGFLAELGEDTGTLEDIAFSYNLPYRLKPKGSHVLIVGAGMGNDVAAALRNGAGHVDAVEIDPAIQALGLELHPEHPYNDPRVAPIVDDARSFFKKSSDRYDVIAFGLLDSHTLLSGLSSVRLDSFVYTLDSFEEVREHLAEDGVAVVTFATSARAPWIEQRLGRMLLDVFGSGKVFVHHGEVGTTFVAGPISPDQLAEAQLTPWWPDPAVGDMPLSTDDWPYLYLRTRTVPAAYWQALLVIGVVCLVVIARSFPAALRPNWHFWLLGAAFLLVEFKSVTEFALLFGTTWLVNALAISGVLLMILVANAIVLRWSQLRLQPIYVLLFASLALAYALPLDVFFGLTPLLRALVSMVVLSLPLLFAGLIFGESLRRAGETAKPLASNLSGSVVGGALEYGSLWWGIKSLYVIAAVVYLGALIASRAQRK
ncbi:MAG TPA: hypothetical protein VJ793_20475 [Anaerolineae bacterium]|nr:hypothetical protein [Anaerolineae bacterium]